ncbi:MAG: gamma-glutamyl-gamma-aminobutyrate hydrolase family protein [Bacteroidales bacterium]|nr:gamma-glutamyl-gamma-aminobutyrate hydrolase family protein [Bacteroidales bacterium]
MRRAVFFYLFLILSVSLAGQDFFRQDFNPKKTYILLANPTENNLTILNYLIKNRLLKINASGVKFVGIYYEGQEYDFSKSKKLIKEKKIKNIYLHEFRGPLNMEDIFMNNHLSSEIHKVFKYSAGAFFFGGPDIPPEIYKHKNTLSKVTDPNRHFFELTFLFHLIGSSRNDSFKPFLEEKPWYFITGFCLGLQTMNVAAGGTLIQDIPAEIFGAETPDAIVKAGRNNLHKNYWQEISDDSLLIGSNIHPIRFTDNPFFGEKVKISRELTPLVYSSHHQAVKDPGKELIITAVSIDEKVVEAIAHSRYPHVFSTQFHPEVPALNEDMQKVKFHPDDIPASCHEFLGKEGREFHKQYWRYLSKSLKRAIRSKKRDN